MPIIVNPAEAPTEATVVNGPEGSPFLAAYGDADPCPRVEITVTVTGTQAVTVWRSSGGQRMKVRGADNVSATAAFFVVDHEVPLARDVQYAVSINGGDSGPSSSVFIPSDVAWLQDPLAPTQSMPLSTLAKDPAYIAGTAFATLTYEMPSQMVSVLGATYPVSLGGTRQAASRVPFDVFCKAVEETSRLRGILTTASPLLLRAIPSMDPVPAVAFLSVASVVEEPLTTFWGGTETRFQLTADLVAGPSISIVVPVWTYADVAALWSTYGEVSATGRTYLDMLRNPEP